VVLSLFVQDFFSFYPVDVAEFTCFDVAFAVEMVYFII